MARTIAALLGAGVLVACGARGPEPAAPSRPGPPAETNRTGCGGKKLRVKFYDVGQALSALVELPDGRRILVDTGEQSTRAGCGAPCKAWSEHLLAGLEHDVPNKKLDLIWVTHQHSDHVGNAAAILETFSVGTYVDNGTSLGDGPVAHAHKAALSRGTRIVAVDPQHPGGPISSAADVMLRPVVPSSWPAKCDQEPNDCSIGLRLDYCRSSILFTGDAEAKEEVLLPISPATVLQAGHHGSDTSSTVRFANAVHPSWVVISSGKKDEGTNRTYCHPHRSTVERLGTLAASNAKRTLQVFQGSDCKRPAATDWATIEVSDHVLSTARDGDVSLVTNGNGEFERD